MVATANELLKALDDRPAYDWCEQEISQVVCDSRKVVAGSLYVAYKGVSVDGHAYAKAAVEAGAVALVLEHDLPELVGVPRVIVPDGREAFARLQAALHGFPGRHLKVIGVTGTDGKTTTSRLIAGILSTAGKCVGTVDTVGATIAGRETPTGFHTTTPDAPKLQSYLQQMVEAGVEYAVVETTSHGLAQHRVTGSEYDIAVVTNITHEHLDFHRTYEAYRDAKAMLFRSLAHTVAKEDIIKTAVLNRDDSSFEYLAEIKSERMLSYGLVSGDVTARDVVSTIKGIDFDLVLPGETVRVHSPLVGRYNVHNILAAATVACALGISAADIVAGISLVAHVEGRMNLVDCGQPFSAIVDFAHTPNALYQALSTVRELTLGRVAVVFGSAGLRDHEKRPAMGRAASELADLVVLTAEDPRTESVEIIMDEIAAGFTRSDVLCWREADRAKAIARALGWAEPGDIVIVAGKGHEQSMCFGTEERPWSDKKAVRDGLLPLGYA